MEIGNRMTAVKGEVGGSERIKKMKTIAKEHTY